MSSVKQGPAGGRIDGPRQRALPRLRPAGPGRRRHGVPGLRRRARLRLRGARRPARRDASRPALALVAAAAGRGPAFFVSLGEGGTPLLRPRHPYPVDLRLKDEGRNPTGSHKDRALAVALAAALAAGVRGSVVVSAGSTGLSHAAYCARAGVRSTVLMSADVDPGRARLLQAYGARVVRVAAPIDPVIQRSKRSPASKGSIPPRPRAPATPTRPRAARRSPTSWWSSSAGRPTPFSSRPAGAARWQHSAAASPSWPMPAPSAASPPYRDRP